MADDVIKRIETDVLSRIGLEAKPTAIRALAPTIEKLEREGAWLVGGAIGQPDMPVYGESALAIVRNVLDSAGIDEIRRVAPAAAHILFSGLGLPPDAPGHAASYPRFEGETRVREEIARAEAERFAGKIDIKTENVAVTAGGSNAIFIALAGLVQPKDAEGRKDVVVFFEPFFSAYKDILRFLRIEAQAVDTTHCGYRPDIEGLDRKFAEIKADGKNPVFLVNSPSNPTSVTYTENEWRDLTVVVRKHEARVIGDDIYRRVSTSRISMADVDPALITDGLMVAADCISKAGNAPGWRSGHIVAHPRIITALAPINLGVGTIFGNTLGAIAHAAGMHVSPEIMAESAEHYARNSEIVVPALAEAGIIKYQRGDGFYAIAEIPEALGKPVSPLTYKAMKEAGMISAEAKPEEVIVKDDFTMMLDLLLGYGIRSVNFSGFFMEPEKHKTDMGVRLVLTGSEEDLGQLRDRLKLYKDVQLGKAQAPKELPRSPIKPGLEVTGVYAKQAVELGRYADSGWDIGTSQMG